MSTSTSTGRTRRRATVVAAALAGVTAAPMAHAAAVPAEPGSV